MWMLNPYLSRHRLQSNNSQNKKLFSDNAMGAFHRDNRNPLTDCTLAGGLVQMSEISLADCRTQH